MAIVIDDIGYKQSDRKLLELSGQLTYAVLPHTPLGYAYAKHASNNHRDVIIHLPMQANTHNELLGPGSFDSINVKTALSTNTVGGS
ncbi:divergent polysaccharide deacetylase family protein [Psychrosphaera algicola]|uniref:Divergent polysaccharide deacetylase family protein n=1 Tax=Psychrosphaera algicola TaxID=3023714 RepID=A0ABT5FD57_9GAMM|nr:divergent polysaccharide deacetylase family protein [Psychrosphaera sp. G1-22]MDC2889470.1 divergent polysaccharide deacetylase family protein [Psychrosphaera sp. G1-22]